MLHIITGPPCAGKSTYVREHAGKGDVRVDYDVLAQAFGSDTPHKSEGAIREVTFKARTAAIEYLVGHAGEVEGWIIHSDPAAWQIEAYEAAGAEFIALDPGMEECLARAVQDDRPESEADDIRDWYANHEKGCSMFKTKSSPLAPMEADGIVKGYASTFDRDPDAYGDIVAPGAFAKSLERWEAVGKPIPLLYGHKTDDPEYNIGKVTEIREDERGLYIEAEFDAENPKAQYVRKLAREGRLYQFSFAYDVNDWAPVELEDGRKANELREIDLFEVSLVQIPANQHAEVLEVKGAEPASKSGRRISKATAEGLAEAMDAIRDAAQGCERAIGLIEQLISDEENDGDSGDSGEAAGTAAAQPKGGVAVQAGTVKADLLEAYKRILRNDIDKITTIDR